MVVGMLVASEGRVASGEWIAGARRGARKEAQNTEGNGESGRAPTARADRDGQATTGNVQVLRSQQLQRNDIGTVDGARSPIQQ